MSRTPVPWRAEDQIEWVYERPEGDIVVYAVDKLQAKATIEQHGFIVVDIVKIKRGESRLSNVLKKDPIR